MVQLGSGNNNLDFVNGSILDKELIDTEVKKADVVFHMAGIADIQEADENPSKTIEFNIIGSLNIINSCSKHNVKLMFASNSF